MATTYDRHIFKQLEEVMKKCDNLSQEIKDIKKQHKQEIYELNQKHEKEVKKLNEKIDSLEKENAELKEEIDVLKGKSNQKNSTNSNIPPSKDEYKIQNHREKSSKKQGGQKGRKGKTLRAEDVEKLIEKGGVKVIEEHYGDVKSKSTTIKYIMDIETKVVIRKIFIHGELKKENEQIPIECKNNKSAVVYGNNLKALVGIMYAQEVIAFERMAEFLEILTENRLRVSHGSLVGWIDDIGAKCKKTKKKLAKAIRKTKVISTDLTPTSLSGNYAYVRNYSDNKVTLLEASYSKRIQEVQRQNILPNFKGYIMHDHDTGLYNFGIKSNHLECWIHLGRELKYFDEYIKNSWSKELWNFAWNINKERKSRIENNIYSFSTEEIREYENQYDEIIKKGFSENGETPSKYLRNKEKAVLKRLKKYKRNYLNFLKDFEFPFDDNLSERDLRPTKTKKKISGCHRSFNGLKNYCNIRSIISTCIKQKLNYFKILKNIIDNRPIAIMKNGLIIANEYPQ